MVGKRKNRFPALQSTETRATPELNQKVSSMDGYLFTFKGKNSSHIVKIN